MSAPSGLVLMRIFPLIFWSAIDTRCSPPDGGTSIVFSTGRWRGRLTTITWRLPGALPMNTAGVLSGSCWLSTNTVAPSGTVLITIDAVARGSVSLRRMKYVAMAAAAWFCEADHV